MTFSIGVSLLPSKGMTNANMKLVILDVPLDGKMEFPKQDLQGGEAIAIRVVEVTNLYKTLQGTRDYNVHWYPLTVVPQISLSKYFPPTGDIKNTKRRFGRKNYFTSPFPIIDV
jgi:hypothetical protein